MSRRNFVWGVLGWFAPGVVAIPFALLPQAAGGESALLAVILWWAAGTLGCLIAGAKVAAAAQPGEVGNAFMEGISGVALAWIGSIALAAAIKAIVGVLDIGAVAFLIPIPFAVGYGIGFGLARMTRRSV
jgi:hypothetical protein